MKWRTTSRGQFYDRDEGVVVYYDPTSGDTHLINDLAAGILKILAGQDLTVEEILESLQAEIEPEALPELTQGLPGVMEELAALDVVANVNADS